VAGEPGNRGAGDGGTGGVGWFGGRRVVNMTYWLYNESYNGK
jgi:hypothetical protein